MSEFQVRPFAFMRLTHEALRAGFATLQSHAEAGDLDGVAREYAGLAKVIALHARHEEEAFFPLLDEQFDGAVKKAGLWEAHAREDRHQEAFDAALDAGELEGVRAALDAWATSFEKHLAFEEEIMMPLTPQVADSLAGRAEAVGRILDVDWEALKTDHLPYVTASLAAHKPYGPTRMFVAALQVAAGDRYDELAPTVGAAVPPQMREMLRTHGHLPG